LIVADTFWAILYVATSLRYYFAAATFLPATLSPRHPVSNAAAPSIKATRPSFCTAAHIASRPFLNAARADYVLNYA